MQYISWTGLAFAVIAVLFLGVSGPGYRLKLWSYRTGISLVKYSGFISAAAVILSLAGLAVWQWRVPAEGLIPSAVGLLIGGCILGVTLMWKHSLDSVPYIHDITTDTENPPLFTSILPLRAGAENPAAYGGIEVARQQHEGYPMLRPGSVQRPPAALFPQALQAAREMGWEIVHSDPDSLRIEATDTTAWFGFKDDVVIRLSPSATGSRIDVRSVSRVGKSDLGTNARRIMAYLARVEHQASV
jgi:hypothetical protein